MIKRKARKVISELLCFWMLVYLFEKFIAAIEVAVNANECVIVVKFDDQVFLDRSIVAWSMVIDVIPSIREARFHKHWGAKNVNDLIFGHAKFQFINGILLNVVALVNINSVYQALDNRASAE